jgi:metal-responsive CopG/Arc/MetJ family transcriptional regulator
MQLIHIKLTNVMLKEVDKRAQKLHISRAEYIGQSIELMNQKMHERERVKRLAEASLRTREESMKVNSEFSEVDIINEK